MGANSSKIKQTIESEMQTLVKASIDTSITSEQATEITNRQDNIIDIGGDLVIGADSEFSREQKMLTKAQIIMTQDSATINDLSADLTNKIDDMLTAKTDQKNEGINVGQVNVSDTESISRKKIKTEIDNAIKTSITQLSKSNSRNKQNLGLSVAGNLIIGQGAKFKDLQDSSMDVVSSSVAKNIVKNISKNVVKNETKAKIDSTSSQKNEGITMGMLMVIALIIGLVIAAKFMLTGGARSGMGNTNMQRYQNSAYLNQPASAPAHALYTQVPTTAPAIAQPRYKPVPAIASAPVQPLYTPVQATASTTPPESVNKSIPISDQGLEPMGSYYVGNPKYTENSIITKVGITAILLSLIK